MYSRAGEFLMSVIRYAIIAAVALSVAAPAAAGWNGWGGSKHYNNPPRGSSTSTSSGGTPVPEPSDFALFALGAAGLIAGRWRARR